MKPGAAGAIVGVAAGAPVAAVSRGQTLVPWPAPVRAAFPFALGALVGGAAAACVAGPLALRRGSGRTLLAIGAGAIAVGLGGRVLGSRFLRGLSTQGRDLDPGFSAPPSSPLVTGGPGSALSVDQLGREGARFVGSTTSAEDVLAVTGRRPAADPVRVFVGVDAADTVEERVAIAMDELRRTGAFERSHLLIQAPAGTGYSNPTPVDILEILTGGDCAAVAVGYGLLPSFLSLGKVDLAAQTQGLLLESIRTELSVRPARPRLLLYGESLGAKVQQAAIPAGLDDLDAFGIDAALWVGTPGGQVADAFHRNCAPSSITVDRPEQIPSSFAGAAPRVWFLEHDGDPVVRFRPALIASRPDWLPVDGTRGRNVPDGMSWRPGITWAQVLVDTLFATNVKPGDFQSLGHDYRADLGAVVVAAYGLEAAPEVAARLDERLRALEIRRAERIAA